MKTQLEPQTIEHEFVEFIPDELSDGKVYISVEYATAAHKCFCGCGTKVVTPIHPAGWQLTYDGDTVSFRPSIGNWGFSCRSHYWIRKNRVVWSYQMTEEQIDPGRRRDKDITASYYGGSQSTPTDHTTGSSGRRKRLFGWLK
jgi:hypothetical protein